MAISYVGERAQGKTTAGSGSTQAITVAGAAGAGNTIVLIFAARDTSTAGCSVADSRGNTWTIDLGPLNTYNDFLMVASTRQDVGTLQNSDTITITFGTAPNECRGWLVEEFSGLVTASYVDQTASSSGSAVTSGATGTTSATTQASELAIGAFCVNSDPAIAPITGDAGYSSFTTSVQAANHGGTDRTLWAQYKILSATGTQAMSISWTNGQEGFQSGIVTYKASTGNEHTGHAAAAGTARGQSTSLFAELGRAVVSAVGSGVKVRPGAWLVGAVLSCDTGTWTNSPTSYSYQWQRDTFGGSYTNILGENASTYVVVDADEGCHIRCVVIASNASGSSAPVNSNAGGPIIAVAPTNITQPVVVGQTNQYQTLAVNIGEWDHMGGANVSYAYQWQTSPDNSDWSDSLGATSQSFLLVTADVGLYVRCNVTAINSGGTGTADTPGVGPVQSIPVYRYVDLVPSYDLDNVYNVWTGTRENGSPYTWQNDASIQNYFRRTKQVNSLVSTDGELLNQLQWKTALFSEPLNRIESIAVMPLIHDIDLTPITTGTYGAGAYGASLYGSGGASTSSSALPPEMVPFMEELDAAFAREIGDRIVVHETPPGFDEEQEVEYMIQHVSGSFDNGTYKAARLEFQLWPTSNLSFWIVGDGAKSLAGETTRPSY